MYRRKLLDQLKTYAQRYPQEGAVAERFTDFVSKDRRCFERDCWAGHVTGSAWLLDPNQERLLLTHHKKLDLWLQLGGHSDGDPHTTQVAQREAEEESGLQVKLLSEQILDIDIHEIPARKNDPAHYHFDVRYSFVAQSSRYCVGDESNDLAWVDLAEIEFLTDEASILRMRDKWVGS